MSTGHLGGESTLAHHHLPARTSTGKLGKQHLNPTCCFPIRGIIRSFPHSEEYSLFICHLHWIGPLHQHCITCCWNVLVMHKLIQALLPVRSSESTSIVHESSWIHVFSISIQVTYTEYWFTVVFKHVVPQLCDGRRPCSVLLFFISAQCLSV